jgi:hypothetical protein
MSLFSLFHSLRTLKQQSGRRTCRGRIRLLAMENLEERNLLASTSLALYADPLQLLEFVFGAVA